METETEVKWVPFFFDANMWSGHVRSMEDWKKLRAAYPRESDAWLLRAKEATYNGTRPQAERDERPNYGFYYEHDGERTLRDFFEANGMEIPGLPGEDDRIQITMPYAGLQAMQVCVLPDVPDEEILEHCNRHNPQQVSGGWHTVVRSKEHAAECGVDVGAAPGECADVPGRLHKIVLCM